MSTTNPMKNTKAQQKELELYSYFCPQGLRDVEVSDEDIVTYFEMTEQGKHRDKLSNLNRSGGLEKLLQSKRMTDVHMRMYEQGVLEGSMPYMEILGLWDFDYNPVPRPVMEYMAKNMFKGIDKDRIIKLYEEETKNQWLKKLKTWWFSVKLKIKTL